ncbi:hypothetical protein [Micromonospora aurantiaca (nom. illeg.)]|uniref:hypothetical protein n=1 Tax=Micromonospora aurantiaca (nom. illeg.) TaxID=47850 RepID=UPI003F4A67B8
MLILNGTNTDPMIALERKKVKEGMAGDKLWLRRKPAHGSVIIEGVAPQERAEAVAATAEQVARTVFDLPFTRSQLRDALEERLSVSTSTAYEYISRLYREGRLRHVSGKGRAALYEVVGVP